MGSSTRRQIQQGQEQRLVKHVGRKAVPSEPRDRAWHVFRPSDRPKLRSRKYVTGRDSQQQNPSPRKEWNVVLRARLGGHETDPAQRAVVESRVGVQVARRDHCCTDDQRNERMTRQWTREQQREGNRMQHAEPDPRCWKHRITGSADYECAGGDSANVAPEPRRRWVVAICEHQAYTGDHKKRRQDQSPRVEPERIAIEVPLRQADMAEVETEVIGDHGQYREATQRVEAADTCRRTRTGGERAGSAVCFATSFPPAAHVSAARCAIARAPRRTHPVFQARLAREPPWVVSTAVPTELR